MTTRKRSKKEFSKIILIVTFIINISVIVFSCVMMVITQDLSPLAYLIPSVAGEAATGTAFYYNKAKTENKLKLMKEYDIKPEENTVFEEGGASG